MGAERTQPAPARMHAQPIPGSAPSTTAPRSHRPRHSVPRRPPQHGTATGIYGLIVTAAVLASSHAASAIAIDLTVLATLLIYWTAERYARLLAARVEDAKRPRWAHVRTELLTGWEFVTVSALPLLVLILARLAGASLDSAILWALWGCTALLGLSGWHIGARGNLSVTERLSTALAAALFGVVLIGLKTMLH